MPSALGMVIPYVNSIVEVEVGQVEWSILKHSHVHPVAHMMMIQFKDCRLAQGNLGQFLAICIVLLDFIT